MIPAAVKSSYNPEFNKPYADLSATLEAIRKPMQASGLALTIGVQFGNGVITLDAFLVHQSGQFIHFDPFHVLLTKKDAQGQGGAITYGRRFLVKAILGVADEDDDGTTATGKAPADPTPPTPETPAPAPQAQPVEPPAHWVEAGAALAELFKATYCGEPVFTPEEVEGYRSEYLTKETAASPKISGALVARVRQVLDERTTEPAPAPPQPATPERTEEVKNFLNRHFDHFSKEKKDSLRADLDAAITARQLDAVEDDARAWLTEQGIQP